MANPVEIEVFSDYVCPWCYLNSARVAKLRREHAVEARLVHFPLHPETPMEGLTLEQLFAGRDVDPDAMHNRMKSLMDAEGLPYNRRTHTYNSRLAQELGKWADTKPGGGAIHAKLFEAYFVHGRNLADPDILVAIAEAVGLPADEARAVIAERRFEQAVDRDWARARAYGVTGVPTMVAGGYGLVGAQPYEALEQLVGAAATKPRT